MSVLPVEYENTNLPPDKYAEYNKPNFDFGTKSLIHVLENVDILINRLFKIKRTQSFETEKVSPSPSFITPIYTSVSQNGEQSKNHGLDILLYMLQNTDKLLQTIIEIKPEKKSLYESAKSYIDVLKSYDFKQMIPEVKLVDPDISNENLNIGLNSSDYFGDSKKVTVSQSKVQNLIDGLNKKPIEKEILQKTEIELIPSKNKEEEFDFIVKEFPETKKTPKQN